MRIKVDDGVRKTQVLPQHFVESSKSRPHQPLPPTQHDEGLTDLNESMRQRIESFREDIKELELFYNVQISISRKTRLGDYYDGQLKDLETVDFDAMNQEGKIDYLLLKNYIERDQRRLKLDVAKDKDTESLMPFADTIIGLYEARQRMTEQINAADAAQKLSDTHGVITNVTKKISTSGFKIRKTSAFRAAKTIDQLHGHLSEWFSFYDGYDPMFTWWVKEPYSLVSSSLQNLSSSIRENLVGIKKDDTEDAIVGDPIGRSGLTIELSAEKIPYTPEELTSIGDNEYAWCEAEMIAASTELGYGSDWHAALEYVKTLYVPPGSQPNLVHDLSREAIDFVKQQNLVTVPPLAEELIRTYMMSPSRQKANPFFLGGDSVIVSYPTSSMSHDLKLMSLKGNNIHFSRSTVFHELIPGHHLQFYYMARHRPYRRLFTTPFWIEGWSLYWEMVLWNNPSFPKTAENRIGMLFWRMHRCARITFSLKFHLGEWDAQECIDYLVERVGHERSTAEGEVRRSLAGDYSPLYQAGYMVGGLQIMALRKEMIQRGMGEKEFHDGVLKSNQMPIELLRALMQKKPLTREWETSWRFYEGLE